MRTGTTHGVSNVCDTRWHKLSHSHMSACEINCHPQFHALLAHQNFYFSREQVSGRGTLEGGVWEESSREEGERREKKSLEGSIAVDLLKTEPEWLTRDKFCK